MVEQFEPLDDHEFELWLEKLIDHVQNQRLPSNVVELKAIELAVKVINLSKNITTSINATTFSPLTKDCANEQQQSSEDVFCVISAFDVPRFQFNPDLRKYEPALKKQHSLFDSADAKAQLFLDRYVFSLLEY